MSDRFSISALQVVVDSLESTGGEAVLELDKKLRSMLHDEYGKGVESSKLGLLPGYYRVAILLAGFISKHTQHKIVYSADVEVSALWMKIRRTVVAIQETVENQRTVRSREQALEEIQQIVELSSPGDETPFGYTKLNDDDRTRIFSAIEKFGRRLSKAHSPKERRMRSSKSSQNCIRKSRDRPPGQKGFLDFCPTWPLWPAKWRKEENQRLRRPKKWRVSSCIAAVNRKGLSFLARRNCPNCQLPRQRPST